MKKKKKAASRQPSNISIEKNITLLFLQQESLQP